MVPKDLPKPSELDLLGSAGPAANPRGETPSGATERSELDSECTVSVLVALPELTHFQSHPQIRTIAIEAGRVELAIVESKPLG